MACENIREVAAENAILGIIVYQFGPKLVKWLRAASARKIDKVSVFLFQDIQF